MALGLGELVRPGRFKNMVTPAARLGTVLPAAVPPNPSSFSFCLLFGVLFRPSLGLRYSRTGSTLFHQFPLLYCPVFSTASFITNLCGLECYSRPDLLYLVFFVGGARHHLVLPLRVHLGVKEAIGFESQRAGFCVRSMDAIVRFKRSFREESCTYL